MTRLLEVFLIFAIITLTIHGLTAGSDLLIPIFISIVIWYLIISMTSAVSGLSLFGWHVPYWLALSLAILFCVGIIYSIFTMVMANITEIMAALPVYQARLIALLNKLLGLLGFGTFQDELHLINQDAVMNFISGVAQTLTWLAGSTGIITIYVLFLLLEYRTFDEKLAMVIKDENKFKMTQRVIKQISSQSQSYMRIKTLLSLMTAVISYFVMRFVGVDFAGFWAQLIFFFNFIPTIGSIIATILPCLLAILQFESWYPFIIVSITLVTIQFTIGNIIEPRVIGKSVNLSGLVIIISLAIWGKIWGIAGMFLCVPIMVILNIIFANFEKTKPLAIILSSSGGFEHDSDD